MAETLRSLIDAVLTRLGLEDGVDVQVYTEERVKEALQHKFDVLFDDYWWPQFFTEQEAYTLDGTTGRVVGDLTALIKRFSDIHSIYNQYSSSPLPRAPRQVRLENITMPCVGSVPDKTKVFRILPVTTTGTIWVSYRTKPDSFQNDDDEIDMDRQAMVLGTCWDILNDDGTNPGAEDKFQKLYNDRVKQLTRNEHNLSQTGYPRETVPINRWL